MYWAEGRPDENGRTVIVHRSPDGSLEDVTPHPFNARTRVHEYGGGAFVVSQGHVYFSNFDDNCLYASQAGSKPVQITNNPAKRYADLVVDATRNRLLCVCEDHTTSDIQAQTTIAAIDLATGAEQTLVSNNDFFASPRLNPDGSQLVWLTWSHPNMPWDGTELWLADVAEDGLLTDTRMIAGGPNESIAEPSWSPTGDLYYISDRSNWWNLYQFSATGSEPVVARSAEFTSPQWTFAQSHYGFSDAGSVVAAYTEDGWWKLAQIQFHESSDAVMIPLQTDATVLSSVQVQGSRAVFIAASPTTYSAVVLYDLKTQQTLVLRSSCETPVDSAYLSHPKSIAFPTENGLTAYAYYYPPHNPDYEAPANERPPLLVHTHGGPTSAATSALSLGTQYWTSRGFAVVDVNYGGSSGYGRQFRDRLKGNWGIVDVADCVNAALYLVDQGQVDRNRMAIAGGSAGGYTTLAALAFRDVFGAGASHFGLSELEVFATETHKFESRYMDGLLGPYPERKDIYYARSPIHFTDQISCPVIFFQGLDDKIVPPNQAELMVEELRAKHLPVAYIAFPGEGHGFRRAANIRRAVDGEFYFYSRVFGFAPADEIEPVPIDNL